MAERVPLLPVSQQQKAKMLKEMNAPSKETRDESCQEIRQWLEAEHSTKTDDTLIMAFLVGAQFNIDFAKEKISNYLHRTGTQNGGFFTDLDPYSPSMELSSKIVNMCILPPLTSAGHRVVFSQIADPSSKQYSLVDSFRRMFAQMDVALRWDGWSGGYVFILSGRGAGLAHASQWTPSVVRCLFNIIEKSRPEPVLAWHFMDMNMLLKPVFAVTLKVLSDESMRNKVYFNDKKHLAGILPKDVLPKQYGGEADYDFDKLNEDWHKYLQRNRPLVL